MKAVSSYIPKSIIRPRNGTWGLAACFGRIASVCKGKSDNLVSPNAVHLRRKCDNRHMRFFCSKIGHFGHLSLSCRKQICIVLSYSTITLSLYARAFTLGVIMQEALQTERSGAVIRRSCTNICLNPWSSQANSPWIMPCLFEVLFFLIFLF